MAEFPLVEMLVPVPSIGDAELAAIESCYWLLTSGRHFALDDAARGRICEYLAKRFPHKPAEKP